MNASLSRVEDGLGMLQLAAAGVIVSSEEQLPFIHPKKGPRMERDPTTLQVLGTRGRNFHGQINHLFPGKLTAGT